MTTPSTRITAACLAAALACCVAAPAGADEYSPTTAQCRGLKEVLVDREMIRPDLSTPISTLTDNLSRQSHGDLKLAAAALGMPAARGESKDTTARRLTGVAHRCHLVTDDPQPVIDTATRGSSALPQIIHALTTPDPVAAVITTLAGISSAPGR
ncbi:hypothetical protein ACFSSC_07780 [Corynebacterium mendelii]|uniref:Secreted protein n=1 Tax=Corynebacterium mendelii TaxID=2765362 RepID=A0A939IYK5_9CORY|nr:hypothetical protein [Corynebacterium mendelii]MBN9644767.1 hypothetical protein [Corynebacterium mendelii]